MKSLPTHRAHLWLACALACGWLVSGPQAVAQDRPIDKTIVDPAWSDDVRNQIEMRIAATVVELSEAKTKFGSGHPRITQLNKQIDQLKQMLANADQLNNLNEQAFTAMQAAASLRYEMQKFGDTMERLSKQIKAFEKMENDLQLDKLASRNEFFSASENMFKSSQRYFTDLENFLQEKKQGNNEFFSDDLLTDLETQRAAAAQLQAAQLEALAAQRAALAADAIQQAEQAVQFEPDPLLARRAIGRLGAAAAQIGGGEIAVH